MSKFTPGPYQRDGNLVYALTICTSGRFKGVSVNKWAAYVQAQNGEDGANQEECEAVATLFATAPKLLECLKEALADAEDDGRWDPEKLQIWRETIAKAEGREV